MTVVGANDDGTPSGGPAVVLDETPSRRQRAASEPDDRGTAQDAQHGGARTERGLSAGMARTVPPPALPGSG